MVHRIKFILFILICTNGFSQDFRVINTKDLPELVSTKKALDSILLLTNNIPMVQLDKETSLELCKLSVFYPPSSLVENILIDYASKYQDKIIASLLEKYLIKKIEEIPKVNPQGYGFPRIEDDFLLTVVANKTRNSDSLLICYYDAWNKKLKESRETNNTDTAQNVPLKKAIIESRIHDSNINCYYILLALNLLNNDFYNDQVIEYHRANLKKYERDFKLEKDDDWKLKPKIIFKEKRLTSIEFLDLLEENWFKDFSKGYNERCCCNKTLIYNKEIGYLSMGCVFNEFAGRGIKYKIKIRGKTIKIYNISTWIM